MSLRGQGSNVAGRGLPGELQEKERGAGRLRSRGRDLQPARAFPASYLSSQRLDLPVLRSHNRLELREARRQRCEHRVRTAMPSTRRIKAGQDVALNDLDDVLHLRLRCTSRNAVRDVGGCGLSRHECREALGSVGKRCLCVGDLGERCANDGRDVSPTVLAGAQTVEQGGGRGGSVSHRPLLNII